MDNKIILKCRTCLGEHDEEDMFDLFHSDDKQNHFRATTNLAEKLEFCCGVRIRPSADLPTKMCLQCFEIMRAWYNFRHMCLNAQVYLESVSNDRTVPAQYRDDEVAYLEYLFEDLLLRPDESDEATKERTDSGDSPRTILSYDSESENEPNMDYVMLDMFDFENSENSKDIKKEETITNTITAIEPASPEEHKPDSVKQRIRKEYRQAEVAKLTKPIKLLNKRANAHTKHPVPVHIRHSKPKDSPTSYMCSYCGNVYTKKTAFAYHMTLHGTKIHQCELCDKKFRQVSELKNHMRRHTGEKPYKCSYCDRHFIDRSERLRHERVHTNDRPYACQVCGKSFTYSATLKNHLKLHTGQKDFNCLLCNKDFRLSHQYKAHLLTLTHKQKELQSVAEEYNE